MKRIFGGGQKRVGGGAAVAGHWVTAYQASKLGQAGAHAAPGADAPAYLPVDRSRVACSFLDAFPLGCNGDRPFRPSVGADVSRKRRLRLGQPPSAGCHCQYAGAKHIGERAFSLARACGCQKSASTVSCGDVPGPAAVHDERPCPFACFI